MKQYIIIAIAAVALIGAGGWLAFKGNSPLAVQESNKDIPEMGQEYANQGQQHIANGQAHEGYNSNPPTSGPHYVTPADWGVYPIEYPDEELVHNLEHGGIWISYKDIDDATKTKLEAIARANPGSVVMAPRNKNDSKIILASWTRLEKMDAFDEQKVLAFIKANKDKSPEPIAR